MDVLSGRVGLYLFAVGLRFGIFLQVSFVDGNIAEGLDDVQYIWNNQFGIATNTSGSLAVRQLQGCSQTDKISLQLKWLIQAQFAGYVAARENGGPFGNMYRKECILCQIRNGDPTLEPINEVLEGFSDVAIVSGGSFIEAVASGKPVTSIGALHKANGMGLVALRNFCGTSSCSLEDLNGKTVGVYRDSVVPVSVLLKERGVSVTLVPKSYGVGGLFDGTWDAAGLMMYNEVSLLFQMMNPTTGYLYQRDDFLIWDNLSPSVDEVLVVRDETLKTKPLQLRRFLRGVVKGWTHCRNNERECVEYLPNVDTAHQRFMLREILKLMYPKPDGFGHYTEENFWNSARALHEMGVISSLPTALRVNNTLMDAAVADVAADLSYAEVNGLGWNEPSLEYCAPKGTSFFDICEGFGSTLCGPGEAPVDQGVCAPCPSGRFVEEEGKGNTCKLCKPGSYAAKNASHLCSLCDIGTSQHEEGSTECTACPPGTMAEQIGQAQCTPCPKGFYRGFDDVVCQRCPTGQYSSKEGQAVCQTCGKLLTTLFKGSDTEENCICQDDYYKPLGNQSSCQKCKEGMTCKAGSALKNYGKSWSEDAAYPTLKAQYWSSTSDPLSVYRCENDKVCPGGDPGDCPSNLQGLMCSQCAEGWRREGDQCHECTDLAASQLLFPVLPLLLGPILVAILYWRNRDRVEEWGSWNNGVAALFLLLLNHYQMVGLIKETKLQLTESVKEYWQTFTYLNSLLSILRPECAGMADFRVSYIVGALVPLIIAGIFLETFVIAFLVSKCKPELRMEVDHTFNAYCSLLFAFYVAVCKGSIDVFLCNDHPNNMRTLSRAPYIYCESDDWKHMLGVGVFALAVCLLTAAVFAYQLWIAPQVFHQAYFQKRWKFLVMKFRPDVWWWGTVWLLKGLLMNLVLLSSTSFGQLFGLFFVMCGYLILTVSYYPWRHMSANMLERQISVSSLLVAFLALCNNSFEFESQEAATWCLVISTSPLVLFAAQCIFLVTRTSDRVKQWTQSRNRLIGLHLQRSFAPMVQIKQEELDNMLANITEADISQLVSAADVIMTEFCGQQARQSRLRQRLITSQKRMIPDCSVNGITINRRVQHPTAECQLLHLDEALPASTAFYSLLTSTGLRDCGEALSQAATSVSNEMNFALTDRQQVKPAN